MKTNVMFSNIVKEYVQKTLDLTTTHDPSTPCHQK